MLYFSKLKLVIIYFVIVFLSVFSIINFLDLKDTPLLSKKVNLGLDLQGGSYLLLEVDSKPVIEEKIQNKLVDLRKILKSKKIKYQNLKLNNQSINFTILEEDEEKYVLSSISKRYSFEMKKVNDQNWEVIK